MSVWVHITCVYSSICYIRGSSVEIMDTAPTCLCTYHRIGAQTKHNNKMQKVIIIIINKGKP